MYMAQKNFNAMRRRLNMNRELFIFYRQRAVEKKSKSFTA